jgi:molybdenum cofactor cytidylyltransferase
VTTAAIVLAAGGGARFDGPSHKLLAPLRGLPVVAHAVSAVVEAGFDDVFVVVGAVELSDVLPAGITVVVNQRWAEGQATSVRAGIRAAAERGHDAVVIGLGDQPFIGPEPWRAVAACVDHPIAVATYDGRRRNPVRLAKEVWDLVPDAGDEGARVLMRGRPELVSEVPCQGTSADIDTAEDLAQWS